MDDDELTPTVPACPACGGAADAVECNTTGQTFYRHAPHWGRYRITGITEDM